MSLRPELAAIAAMIPPRARVLDIGCGDGALLEHLAREKQVDARGIELAQQNVNACVARGLSVIQGDADTDLADYPDGVFDVAILSQTIQATRAPAVVLAQLIRIAGAAIVSLPNFGHWRVRLTLLASGRMPRTASLDHAWYDTPNIHLCTLADFVALAEAKGARIDEALALDAHGRTRAMGGALWRHNLTAGGAIFRLRPNG